MKNEINDLRKSLEFTQYGFEEKFDNMEKRMGTLGGDIQEIDEYQIDPKNVHDKIAQLEGRSRRNKLRIDCLKEITILHKK